MLINRIILNLYLRIKKKEAKSVFFSLDKCQLDINLNTWFT